MTNALKPWITSLALFVIGVNTGAAPRQTNKEAWRFITEKDAAHVVDGRMLEAFLVTKRKAIDAYRPPNRLGDYNVHFFDYGPYWGFGFVAKPHGGEKPSLGGYMSKRPVSGIVYLVDKKTMRFAGSFAQG